MRLFLIFFIALGCFAQTTIQTFSLTEQFGVSHREQDIDLGLVTSSAPRTTSHRVLGIGDVEWVWQQTSDGHMHIRSRLPRSFITQRCKVTQVNSTYLATETPAFGCFGNYQDGDGISLRLGDAVAFEGSSVPTAIAGCVAATPCYLVPVLNTGGAQYLTFFISATQGGAAITGITANGAPLTIIRLGIIQDPNDGTGDTLFANDHDYLDGDPFTPSTTGALPTGMSCNPCFVRDRTADTFKVASTLGGSALNLTPSTGSGYHAATTAWTWRLQSGTTTTVSQTNPVTVSIVGSNYELLNGLTGLRIRTAAGFTTADAAIQGVKLRDGTWTPGAGKMYEVMNTNTQHTDLTSYSVRVLEAGPLLTKLRAEYVTDRPEYTGGNFTIASSDSSADTVTFSTCEKWNQPGVSGYWRPEVNFGPFLTSNLYTFSNTTGCTFQVLLAGTPANITTDLSGNKFYQNISVAGTGYIHETFTLYANQESVVIEDSADTRFQYYLNVKASIDPDHIRGTTHSSAGAFSCWFQRYGSVSTATLSGGVLTVNTATAHNMVNSHTAKVTGMTGITGTAEAQVTVTDSDTFTLACGSCSGTSATGGTYKGDYRERTENEGDLEISSAETKNPAAPASGAKTTCTSSYFPYLLPWYWTATNSPYFGVLYNSTAGSGANVLGIGSGQASRLQYATFVGPGWYSNPAHFADASNAAEGISMFMDPGQGQDFTAGSPMRRQWILHAGTKAGVSNPTEWWIRSNTVKERNELTGINLSKIVTYVTDYADPVGGWKDIFQSTASMASVIALVQNGTPYCGTNPCYYDLLYASFGDSQTRLLLDMWRNNSAYYTGLAVADAQGYAQRWLYGFVSGGGPQQEVHSYEYGASQAFKRAALLVSVILDPNTTAAQKTSAKAILALLASIMHENDFAPMDIGVSTGDSFGSANMPAQMASNRNLFATILDFHSHIGTKFAAARANAVNQYPLVVNSSGAIADGVGYFDALGTPAILSFMALQQKGYLSFADYPNWSKAGDFLTDMQTPPEGRFSATMRKLPATGDSWTEGTHLLGLFGTALKDIDTAKSQKFMKAWRDQNSTLNLTVAGFYASSVLATDEGIASGTATRTSVNYPGYHSVLRHNTDTVNETYASFINGDFYSDHRSHDAGNLRIYAHRSPLSIQYGNFYAPVNNGGFNVGALVINSTLGQNWNDDNASVTAPVKYGTATQLSFSALGKCTQASASFAATPVWTRTVTMCAPNASYPIIYIKDTQSTSAATTLTIPLMSQTGAIVTPAGSCTPVLRNGGSSNPATILPSTGTGNCAGTFGSGLQTFTMTGYAFPAAPGGGINADIIFRDVNTYSYIMGNWRQNSIKSRESGEYDVATGGTFLESQHLLRVSGASTNGFRSYILPHRKDESPTRTITSPASDLNIVQGAETSNLTDTQFTWTNGTAKMLATFDTASHTYSNLTASGCPTEIYYTNSSTITVYISSMASCTSTIDLSAVGGTWYADQPMGNPSTNVFTVHHPGGTQPETYSVAFSTTSGTRRSVPLVFNRASGTVRVRFGSATKFVGSATCSGTCTVTVLSPTGSQSMSWEYDDGAGNVASSGAPVTITVN